MLTIGAIGAWSPLARGHALRALAPPAPRTRARRSLVLPPVAQAGLQFARGSGRGTGIEVGTALASAGAAVIAIVGAACLIASFDDLAAHPARFGAPWDVSVSATLDGTDAAEELLSDPSLKHSIDQAAVITGFDLEIGDETVWVHAFVPLAGLSDDVVPLPIIAGRPPQSTREIAVGEVTLRHLGLSIGDRVPVTAITTGERFDMTIVGTTIVNDTFEASPGRGGAVTPEFIDEAAPEVAGDPVILSLTAGTDVEAFIDEARSGHDGIVEAPLQQAAVRNVGRIRNLPVVMAGIVAVLALASVVHALVLSVRRNRRVLGVLKGLGFTKRQVAATVAWHATSYAVTALVLALPLGVIAGRWGWRLVARSLGVPAVPVVPLLAIALVLVSLVVLANLAAAYPAWRAARLSTAAALRAE